MDNENKVIEIIHEADKFERSDPKKALQILREAVNKYKSTFSVHNYVIPSIFRICVTNQYWDDAIDTCKVARVLYPDESEYWQLDMESCEYKKKGEPIKALETSLKRDSLRGKFSYVFHHYGSEFAKLGARDRAWQLYNQAILLTATEKTSPHLIRESMADFLLAENKPFSAAEILIFGINEAEKYNKNGTPKTTISKLSKSLKKAGLKDPDLPNKLFEICKKQGKQKALDYLKEKK
jgi:tetratricopeptide (TPR) repeat protein